MINNPFSLSGKIILVTGASSGIGQAIAIECANRGAKIVLNGRNLERLKSTFSELSGSGHLILEGDLTIPEIIKNIVSEIPCIDGMVLCAGKAITLPVQFCSEEHIYDLFRLNFVSTVEIVRLLYKKKKIRNGGSIIFMDSVGGVTIFSPGGAIYGATKAALNSYMKFCAREFASRKIRVNCICPGMIDTPLIHRGTLTEEQLQQDAKRYLCGRYGIPADVAYGAVYLLSDASSWVTGTSLFIDGGISIV